MKTILIHDMLETDPELVSEERDGWESIETYVFADEGKHWRCAIRYSQSAEGWLNTDVPVECVEVRQVERTVKVWEPVE